MSRTIDQIVEEQVRIWQLQQKERTERQSAPKEQSPHVITVTELYGSEGLEIANRVGSLLNAPVYDREIVEHIAEMAHVGVEAVQTLDQRTKTNLEDYLTMLFSRQDFDQGAYFQALTKTVAALWHHGPCVIIGRGGAQIIPWEHRLAVRIVASDADRIRKVERAEGLGHAQAARRIASIDADRAGFIRRLFRQNIDDPIGYDMVLNSASLDVEACAAVIVQGYRSKFRS